MSRARVTIVGGGLAGLVAARVLQRAGTVDITLLEREATTGGKVRTEQVGAALVEAGPDSFLTTKPHGLSLCRELGIEAELEGTSPRSNRGFIRRDGKLHPLPDGLSGLVPARLSALLQTSVLSIPGRLRFAADLLVPPAPAERDESVAEFARRRFGDEAYTWLIEPLAGGVLGGDAEELSVRAAFPALWQAEQNAGSVLAAVRESRRAQTGPERSAFVAPRTGMQRIVDALRAALSAIDIRTDEAATAVRADGAGWRVESVRGAIPCDVVILAVPAAQAAPLVDTALPELAAPLREIPHRSATVVHMAFAHDDVKTKLDGYGYLNARASGGSVMACTWTTSKFAHRAEPGTVLLRLFLRGEEWADARVSDDAACVRIAREELRSALDLRATPIWSRIFRWPSAMPQYTIGHGARLRAIDAALTEAPGLFVTGNAYRGVGIPDTIAHATFVAGRATAHLERAAAREG